MFFGLLKDAFFGHYLELDFARRSLNVWVKRHKVLSTSKSLALFCSGLVILLANERSYKRVHTAFPLLGAAETTCGCCSLKSSRHRRRRTFAQRRSANSFSIYYRSSSLHQRRRRRRGARAAYMSRAYLHSLSTALSPFFESYDDYIYECDERVPTAVCHSYIQAVALCLPHTYTNVHTYIVATRQVS